MHRIKKIGLAGVGSCALVLGLVSPAFADYAPSNTDVVGVGSDTVQNISDFISDGDNVSDPGYNAVGLTNKLVSFDATPDANDRAGYLNGSTSASLKALNPTIVLRGGTSPVQRPNGSGAGINALLADHGGAGYVNQINFVRMSRAPKAAEETTALANLGTQLHTVQLSSDPLEIAYKATGSNMPSTGLSVPQLTAIYNCTFTTWTQVGGTSTATIVPLVPQSGSGTRSTFLADIGVASPGSCVQTVEENDPTSITGNADPADAIAPFSAGRLALYNNSYFKDPTVVFPGSSTFLSPGILLQQGFSSGTTHRLASDGNNVYDNVRGLYVVFRESDNTSATPWQAGSSLNWVKTLFVGASAYVKQPFNQALISAAGATPAYLDEGAGFTVG